MKDPMNHPFTTLLQGYVDYMSPVDMEQTIENAAKLVSLLIEVHHASKGDWEAWCEKRQEAWSAEVEQILGEYEMEAPE